MSAEYPIQDSTPEASPPKIGCWAWFGIFFIASLLVGAVIFALQNSGSARQRQALPGGGTVELVDVVLDNAPFYDARNWFQKQLGRIPPTYLTFLPPKWRPMPYRARMYLGSTSSADKSLGVVLRFRDTGRHSLRCCVTDDKSWSADARSYSSVLSSTPSANEFQVYRFTMVPHHAQQLSVALLSDDGRNAIIARFNIRNPWFKDPGTAASTTWPLKREDANNGLKAKVVRFLCNVSLSRSSDASMLKAATFPDSASTMLELQVAENNRPTVDYAATTGKLTSPYGSETQLYNLGSNLTSSSVMLRSYTNVYPGEGPYRIQLSLAHSANLAPEEKWVVTTDLPSSGTIGAEHQFITPEGKAMRLQVEGRQYMAPTSSTYPGIIYHSSTASAAYVASITYDGSSDDYRVQLVDVTADTGRKFQPGPTINSVTGGMYPAVPSFRIAGGSSTVALPALPSSPTALRTNYRCSFEEQTTSSVSMNDEPASITLTIGISKPQKFELVAEPKPL